MDARSGESNSQHILFCGDIVHGGDSVEIVHVAEAQKGKKESFTCQVGSISVLSCISCVPTLRPRVVIEIKVSLLKVEESSGPEDRQRLYC